MTEAEARGWVEARWGSAATASLARYVELLRAANDQQNLIARSTLDTVWHRHIVDSAQLVPMASAAHDGDWIDIGSGAGLPGIVAAILQPRRVRMIEPRRKRVEFLQSVVDTLGLTATAELTRAESFGGVRPAAVISARAVAALDQLFSIANRFSDLSTLWLLPKGKSGQSELADARRTWQGVFHVEQSLTAAESQIIVAQKVQRR